MYLVVHRWRIYTDSCHIKVSTAHGASRVSDTVVQLVAGPFLQAQIVVQVATAQLGDVVPGLYDFLAYGADRGSVAVVRIGLFSLGHVVSPSEALLCSTTEYLTALHVQSDTSACL